MALPAVNDLLRTSDYNDIQARISTILGTGTAGRGYGQRLNSAQIFSGRLASAGDWENLKFDIQNARLHQVGSVPPLVTITEGTLARTGPGTPLKDYEDAAALAETDRFLIAAGQFLTESKATISRSWTSTTSPTFWRVSITTSVIVDFPSANDARWFFNTGSTIRFSSSRTGGSTTSQNTAWTNLLNNVGVRSFSATATGVNFYNLTSSNQTWFTASASSPYTSNSFRVQVRCNVANNSAGTASQIIFTATWTDSYNDPGPPLPGDAVDGTITLNVDQTRAFGVLLPSNATGSFQAVSPTYTTNDITGT